YPKQHPGAKRREVGLDAGLPATVGDDDGAVVQARDKRRMRRPSTSISGPHPTISTIPPCGTSRRRTGERIAWS
ncbi:MAG: hypothetical protein M3N47_13090, partial [Chloroflexota bacterium]|nr:hypothetical protein [Chloroflexota bacterium]